MGLGRGTGKRRGGLAAKRASTFAMGGDSDEDDAEAAEQHKAGQRRPSWRPGQ